MDLARVLEKTQGNTVNGRVTPTLVEEATGTVQVVEIVLVRLAAPKVHITNLKVAPEVACRITTGILGMIGTASLVRQPVHGAVLVHVLGVLGQELFGLGPQSRDGSRGVVQVDGEAVRLVVIVHVAENVIVDIAEEVNVGLDAPVVLRVGQGRVLIEHAAVPPAHLVVRDLVGILDLLFFEDLDRLVVQVLVNPRWHFPVFLGDKFCNRRNDISPPAPCIHTVWVATPPYVPYLTSAFVTARVLFLNSSEKGTSLKKVQG